MNIEESSRSSTRVRRSIKTNKTSSTDSPKKTEKKPVGQPKDGVERSKESREGQTGRESTLAAAVSDAFGKNEKIGKQGDGKAVGSKPRDPERASVEQINKAIEQVGETGDRSQLDSVDYFRESLPPEQQEEYDRQLQEIREDDRIEFEYDDRLDDPKYLATLTPEQREYAESLGDNPEAYEDLFLRGFVASSFGRPERRDEAIDRAADDHRGLESRFGAGDHEDVDGKFEVRLGVENFAFGDEVTALAYANGGAIDANVVATVTTLATPGDQGIPAHEFEHILNNDGLGDEAAHVPADVSVQDSERLVDLYKEANPGLQGIDQSHVYTDVLNDFLADPQKFSDVSPELYELVADIQGYDPVNNSYPQHNTETSSILDRLWDLLPF